MAAVAQPVAPQQEMQHREFLRHRIQAADVAATELDERDETDREAVTNAGADAVAETAEAESTKQPPDAENTTQPPQHPLPATSSSVQRRRSGRKAPPRRTTPMYDSVGGGLDEEDVAEEADLHEAATSSKRARVEAASTDRLCNRCCRPLPRNTSDVTDDKEASTGCPACPRLYHSACWSQNGGGEGPEHPCAECQALLESEAAQLTAAKDPDEIEHLLGSLADGLVAISEALAKDANGRKHFFANGLAAGGDEMAADTDCPADLPALRRKARGRGFASAAAYASDLRLMGHRRLEQLGAAGGDAAEEIRALLRRGEQLTADLGACVHCYSSGGGVNVCPSPHPIVWAAPAGCDELWPGRDISDSSVSSDSEGHERVRVHFFGFPSATSGGVQLLDSRGVFLHSETPELPDGTAAAEAVAELRRHLELLQAAGHRLTRPRTQRLQAYSRPAAAAFFASSAAVLATVTAEEPAKVEAVAETETATVAHRWLEAVKSDALKAFTAAVDSYLAKCRPPPPLQQQPQEQESPQQESLQQESLQQESPQQQALEQTRHLTQRLALLRRQHAVEMSRLQFLHQLQAFELEHNHRLAMCELRAAFDIEKQNLLTAACQAFEADARRQVEETKRRQWCAYCAKEAFFYCCWNTSYCDAKCQQKHWPQHMASCSQTRPGSSAATGAATGGPLQVHGFHPLVSPR